MQIRDDRIIRRLFEEVTSVFVMGLIKFLILHWTLHDLLVKYMALS